MTVPDANDAEPDLSTVAIAVELEDNDTGREQYLAELAYAVALERDALLARIAQLEAREALLVGLLQACEDGMDWQSGDRTEIVLSTRLWNDVLVSLGRTQ